MRAAIIQFPGSNAAAEARLALEHTGFEVELTFHKSSSFAHPPDLVVIPGGFAFGDHLRAGALARVSPIAHALHAHQKRGGLILGICNGFQILLELGMLPGALLPNAAEPREAHDGRDTEHSAHESRFGFRSHDVELQSQTDGTFTRRGDTLTLPIAHAFGRYHCDDDVLKRLEDHDQVALTYANNPNGSVANIAGIYDRTKRTLGLMPHPERACVDLGGGPKRPLDGRRFFESAAQVVS